MLYPGKAWILLLNYRAGPFSRSPDFIGCNTGLPDAPKGLGTVRSLWKTRPRAAVFQNVGLNLLLSEEESGVRYV